MGIKDIIKNLTQGKQRRQEYELDQRIAERYHEKKLSANERELMSIREQQRQAWIRKQLEQHRYKEMHEFMSGRKNNPIFIPNILVGHKKLFGGKSNLCSGGKKYGR